jgi:hypothetical protein
MTSIKSGDDADSEFELDPQLKVVAKSVKQGLAFWKEKRGQRLAPGRDQFSLRETKHFAPHLQILELLDNGRAYRQRLTGTALVAQLKYDPTGSVYDYSSADAVVHRMLRAIGWVVEHKTPLRTVAHRTALSGQDFMTHETVFLPLSSDGKTIDMMAVVSAFTPVAKSKQS